MSKVKLKRGNAEVLLAKRLWHSGYRYRYNNKKFPGSPDITISRYRLAIFVDGEFWHGKDWETRKSRLKRNRDYWIEKIEENMARDQRNNATLEKLGWSVLRFWSKEVETDLDACVALVDEAVMNSVQALS